MAPPGRNTLPRGWTCDDVGAVARETCRNWFYKTACIRELLPRILIEVGRTGVASPLPLVAAFRSNVV